MKKFITALLILAMVIALVACGKKDNQDDNDGKVSPTSTQSTSGNTQTPAIDSGNTQNTSGDAGTENASDDGRVTDPVKLGESITYWVDGEHLYFKIKTSAEIDAHKYSIAIVNPGIYLTRDSEFINRCIYENTVAFAEKFDKEYYDGYYVFWVDNNIIKDLASDESEWAPGNWSVLLYNEDTRLVLGQWLIVLEGGGKYHFEFNDSWLYGAGEDRKVKEFDSLEEEVESWFTFKPDESYDEWAVFNFDGYYLEQIDPYGYDKYYLFVCPEGDYTTYGEAAAVDLTYCDYGGFEYARCPYRFAFEQDGLEPGKYTFVLARNGSNDLGVGGNVEIQFDAEKKGPQDWKMDFSNAKCPMLESKYGVESPSENTGDASLTGGDPAEYSREYWEAKYPGENVCSFYIEENGKEYSYYWVSGVDGWDGTMASWINQPFNWNDWHKASDGCIVNKDETLKITDEWANGDESMSSYCTVTTEKYEKSKHDGYPEHVPTAPEEPDVIDNIDISDDTDNTDDASELTSTSSYKLNIPADGFRVESVEYHDGIAYQCITTKKGNVFTYEDEHADQKIRYDYNAETAYLDDWSGSYGWAENGEWFWDANPYDAQKAYELYSFDEFFMSYFEACGFDGSDLEKYCIGTEAIAGCSCWIIDAKGFNGITDIYWVNMENGACMKLANGDGTVDFEVTGLDLNY